MSVCFHGRAILQCGLPIPQLTRTSGILYLCSLSALKFQAIAVTPKTTPSMMAVFARQFLGWAYQPPAGDQMCLGYLYVARWSAIGEISLLVRKKATYGTLAPPPMSACVGFIVAMWCVCVVGICAAKAANHHAVLVEVRLDGGRSGQAAGVTSAEREKSKSCASSFADALANLLRSARQLRKGRDGRLDGILINCDHSLQEIDTTRTPIITERTRSRCVC